jgi:short-subunit dehydrogenase
MRKQGHESIINIGSGLALMYLPGMSIYSSLKRALSHISLTAREELKEDNITVSVMYPYITLTDFEENTIKTPSNEENGGEEEGEYEGPPSKPDSAEYVAQKIAEGIESEEAEIFAHDWMKRSPAT